MMKDLVLEWRAEGEKSFEIILPNIQGQMYVFGSKYPGGREGEEFIFFRKERILIDHTHIVIRVDELGQYWIQSQTRNNDTTKFITFLNTSRLSMEPHLLRFGDTVFLEEERSKFGHGYTSLCHPIFHVKERSVPGGDGDYYDSDSDGDYYDSDSSYGSDNESLCKATNEPDLDDGAEIPLDNTLILEKIFGYLSVRNLKKARLVCKKWKTEASKHLEKKGTVSFTFNYHYLNPEYSTRVFRYLHEMRDMKMRNLHINLCPSSYQSRLLFAPGEPWLKMMGDLRKLLNSSHNFSTLHLQADIQDESGLRPFATIFQELGEKLVELKLEMKHLFIPAVLPPFPLMGNLKKLTAESMDEMEPRWVSQLVPLFSNNLEHFTCDGYAADTYLQEFVKHPMPKLKALSLRDATREWDFSTLLELETPLTFLEIHFVKGYPEPEEVLGRLLLKHSSSLQHLVIGIDETYYYDHRQKDPKVRFPSFPNLKVLELEYGRRARISWETGLDYGVHFPSLRKLTVRPLKRWSNGDQVFNAFFPEEGNLRVETVEEVWIPVLDNPRRPPNWPFEPEVEIVSF